MVNQILGDLSQYGVMRWSHQKPDRPSAAPVFGIAALFLPLFLFLLVDRAGAAEGCYEASRAKITGTYRRCLRLCPPPTNFRGRTFCFKQCKGWFYKTHRREEICELPPAIVRAKRRRS